MADWIGETADWRAGALISLLVRWLVSRLVEWLTGWLVGNLIGCDCCLFIALLIVKKKASKLRVRRRKRQIGLVQHKNSRLLASGVQVLVYEVALSLISSRPLLKPVILA